MLPFIRLIFTVINTITNFRNFDALIASQALPFIVCTWTLGYKKYNILCTQDFTMKIANRNVGGVGARLDDMFWLLTLNAFH
jgi:hypothetical protein